MQRYEDLCVEVDISLRDAMRCLDRTSRKILFLTQSKKLVASFTDGDLRRFLLKGGELVDKAIAAANKNPKFAYSVSEAKTLVRNLQYVAVPVVDKDRNVTNIVFADDEQTFKLRESLALPVVIMAGGKGTRLDPYTRILPKPLIPIGDLPIIEHIMKKFSEFGCCEFHIIINYKKELIKAYFSENSTKYNIHWYEEIQPLGTGGGLSLLRGNLQSTFFFTNCDIIVNSDYSDILRFHKSNKNSVTMVSAYKNIMIPYGVIETEKDGVIVRMKEKPEVSFQTNTGMYIVEPSVLDFIKDGVPIGFPDVLKLNSIGRIAAYPVSSEDWLDMGQMDELDRMRKKIYGE